MGSGKTTVSNIFLLLDIPVYIADIESKKLTDTSPVVKEKLITLFGNELYRNDKLDKKLLASHIFNDKAKLEEVNKIIHPEVKKDFDAWLSLNKDKTVVAIESAIMFESGFSDFVDKTIMVYSPLEDRIKRSMKRDSRSRAEILNRINSQMPDEEKKKLSDFIIVNDNKHSLIKQTLSLLDDIQISLK